MKKEIRNFLNFDFKQRAFCDTKCKVLGYNDPKRLVNYYLCNNSKFVFIFASDERKILATCNQFKPYLKPMSSMTKQQQYT